MITKSTVKEVQVYRSSASVIRSGEVALSEGRNIVYIGGMTCSANQEDFVLSFPGNVRAANIQIISIDDIKDLSERESEKIQMMQTIVSKPTACSLTYEKRTGIFQRERIYQ